MRRCLRILRIPLRQLIHHIFWSNWITPGLSVNTATGQISGATTQAGSFVVNLTASNQMGRLLNQHYSVFAPVTPSRYVVVDLSADHQQAVIL